MKRWLRFNAIGIAGAAVQLTALKLLSVVGVHYLIATALAVEAAVLHNFFWHCRWTWKETGGSLLRFHLANGLVSIVANLATTRLLVEVWNLPLIAANAIAIASAGLLNYAACLLWVFKTSPD